MYSPPSPTQLQFYSLGNFNQKTTLNLKCPAVLYLSPLTIIYINHVKLIASNDQGKNFLFLFTYFSSYLYCAALFRKLILLMAGFIFIFKKMATDFNCTQENFLSAKDLQLGLPVEYSNLYHR